MYNTKLFQAGKNLLRFGNLLDRNNHLSITNVAVIVIITKMALAPFDWAVAAGLLVTMVNYAHKRSETNKTDKALDISKLSEQVTQLQETNAAIIKQSVEVKNLLSKNAISTAFTRTK